MNKDNPQAKADYGINFKQLHLAVRYNTVIFPFDMHEFIKILPLAGYVVSRDIPPIPFGARLSISGEVAKKGDIQLNLNCDKNVIAIIALDIDSPDSLITEFDHLENSIQDELGFKSQENAFFYELLSEITITTQKNPLLIMTTQFGKPPLLNELSDLLGHPLSNFALHLVSSDKIPNSPEWMDVIIKPSIPDCDKRYEITIVFRNPERSNVFSFIQNLPVILKKLIAKLEKE